MRAPYQTLTILYKKENKQIKFAIFYRNSHPIWQFVSGGGEDNETPIETVVREIKEETNLDIDISILRNYIVEDSPEAFNQNITFINGIT